MEYCILRLVSKDSRFVELRVPTDSLVSICRMFMNDHNDFIIKIVGRGMYDNVSSKRDDDNVSSKRDEKFFY